MRARLDPGASKSVRRIGLPPPDSPGGLAVLWAFVLGLAYVLLFVGAYSALCAEALWVATLNLLLGVLLSFFLVAMVSSERARAVQFELEFARTTQAHRAAGETLVEASPLGGILRAYARAAREQRQAAREHAYAAGPAFYSTGAALLATLLVGLAYATGSDPNLVGIAMLFELVAFALLGLSSGILALSVGRTAEVPEFDPLVLRRWSDVSRPTFPYTHALSEAPWAADATEPTIPPVWQETVVPDRRPA